MLLDSRDQVKVPSIELAASTQMSSNRGPPPSDLKAVPQGHLRTVTDMGGGPLGAVAGLAVLAAHPAALGATGGAQPSPGPSAGGRWAAGPGGPPRPRPCPW